MTQFRTRAAVGSQLSDRVWAILASGFGVFFVLGVGASLLGPTIPDLRAEVVVPAAMIGLVRVGRQAGQFAAAVVAGRFFDRVRISTAISIGGLIFVGGVALIGLSWSPWAAVTGSLLWGIGHGVMNLGPTVLVGRALGNRSSIGLSLLHVVYGVGGALGPVLVYWVTQTLSWRASYAVLAIGAAILAVVFVAFRDAQLTQPVQRSQRAVPARRWAPMIPSCVAVFCFNGVNAGVIDWLFTQARLVAHSSLADAAFVSSLYWACITAGRVVVIPFLRWFADSTVLLVCGLLSVVGALVAALSGQSIAVLAIGIGVLGLFLAPIYPVAIAREGNRAPEARGSVTGRLTAVAAVGAIAIPLAQSWVAGSQSGGFEITAALTTVMGVALVILKIAERQEA